MRTDRRPYIPRPPKREYDERTGVLTEFHDYNIIKPLERIEMTVTINRI